MLLVILAAPSGFVLNMLAGTVMMLLLALVIIIFMFTYQRKLYNQQVRIREMQEQAQRQMLQAAMQAQENERRRIAGDLHDEIGSMLSVVQQHLSFWRGPALGEQEVQHQQEAATLLRDTVTSVRRISKELMPAVLDKFGLMKALDGLCRTVPEACGTAVRFRKNAELGRLQPQTELLIFRIVQELLQNSLKHAAASLILIELGLEGQRLVLRFEDNGKGFDYEAKLAAAELLGLGLLNLQNRVNLLNGILDFYSEPGKGTKISIQIPLM